MLYVRVFGCSSIFLHGLVYCFYRDFIKSNQANMYNNSQMDSGLLLAATMPENNVMDLYQSPMCDQAKTSMNQAESGLTYNNLISAPRKRSRDTLMNEFNNFTIPQQKKLSSGISSSFVDQDIAFQIQQQQSEIDRFIAQHVSFKSLPFLIVLSDKYYQSNYNS